MSHFNAADPWTRTLALLVAPPSPKDKSRAVRRFAKPTPDKANRVSKRNETTQDEKKRPSITIIERSSATTVSITWCDATSCHYVDQIWAAGMARVQGTCAISRQPIHRGDWVYKPRQRAGRPSSNAREMILATVVCEAVKRIPCES
jgi:Domain of unknown function (DUF3331)